MDELMMTKMFSDVRSLESRLAQIEAAYNRARIDPRHKKEAERLRVERDRIKKALYNKSQGK